MSALAPKIAGYTADEPNDELLSAVIDEQKEVLIFKVAVALGLDVPRLHALGGAKMTCYKFKHPHHLITPASRPKALKMHLG